MNVQLGNIIQYTGGLAPPYSLDYIYEVTESSFHTVDSFDTFLNWPIEVYTGYVNYTDIFI